MTLMYWLDINNTLVMIPIGAGYALSWVEALGTLCGLLCIWFASQEKTINYLFGLLNVSLFAVIFLQIQLYAMLLLQLFFLVANIYGWYAWSHPDAQQKPLQVRWLSRPKLLFTALAAIVATALLSWFIDPVFTALARFTVYGLQLVGVDISMPPLAADAFPFWDAMVTVLSVLAQVLMTRKYVENWWLWLLINLISIGLYSAQGVYALALEYTILLAIAANGARQWMATAARNGSRPAAN